MVRPRADPVPWSDWSVLGARRMFLDPLVRWINNNWADGTAVRILDYGCGDRLIATLLDNRFHVDGYDPSASARAAARSRRSSGEVHDRIDEIPLDSYDGVVINSVVQYMADPTEVADTLGRCRTWLGAAPSGVLIADVVTTDTRRISDVKDLLVAVGRSEGWSRAPRLLARTARYSPGISLVLDRSDLRSIADRAGFEIVELDRNLSPLTTRSSFLLTPRPAQRRPSTRSPRSR